MTNDAPRHTPPRETTQPAPSFDVDMTNRQNGDFRQNGNLSQRGNLEQNGRQTLDGRVNQDVNGRVQQNVEGNRLTTGDVRSNVRNDNRNDVRSDNRSGATSGSTSGSAIDDHSVNNRTDKSVNMGAQFLPECTFGLSIGAPGTGAFQIGVPSDSCMKARGQAIETQAKTQAEIARARFDADVEITKANAQASITNTAIRAEQQDASEGRSHVQNMTKIACDFSIDRAGTARQSWQQFDNMGAKIGKHPTAKAGTQQLWTEAVTSSAQSMDAGAVCVESARNELGITAKKFEVPALEIEKPKPPVVHKPKPEAPKEKEKPCTDEEAKAKAKK